MMNCNEKYSWKGSFTLEAAVVVPIVIFILMAVVTVTFYIHDHSVMEAVNYFGVLECFGNGDVKEKNGIGNLSAILSERLVAADNVSVDISGDDKSGYIRSSAEVNIPGYIKFLFENEGLEKLQSTINIKNLNGRKLLILYKNICDGVMEIAGGLSGSGS